MRGKELVGLTLMALLPLVAIAVSGCGKAKEGAAVALEEAKLDISSARKAAGESSAAPWLVEAENSIRKASRSFRNGRYSEAKEDAMAASASAKLAWTRAQAVLQEKEAAAKVAKKTVRRKAKRK